MKFYQPLFTASLFLALTAGSGCGGTTPTGGTGGTGGTGTTTGGVTEGGKVIAGIEITPDKHTLTKGAAQQYRAIVRYADGTTEDITNSKDVVWNTSDPDVVTVARNGVVTANKPGVANVSVQYKGEKADEHVVVMP